MLAGKNQILEVGDSWIRIKLTQGKSTVLDKDDWENVRHFKWTAEKNKGEYRARTYDMDRPTLHKFLFGNPKGVVLHLNGDTLDNRRSNLQYKTNARKQESEILRIEAGAVYFEIGGGEVACVDEEDWYRVQPYRWWTLRIPGDHLTNYVCGGPGKGNKKTLLHRFIMSIFDKEIRVDHVDGNGLNNRKENLRICTQSQNMGNKVKAQGIFTSKYKGVSWSKSESRWVPRATFNGKSYTLARCREESDAAMVYNQKAVELFGEFARLNEAPQEIQYLEEAERLLGHIS